MSKTITVALADCRKQLYEPTAARWTDADLRGWLNDGQRDIARRVWWYRKTGSVSAVAGTQEYSLPSDCLSVYAARYTPTGGSPYDMEPMDYKNVAAELGTFITTSQGISRFFWTWGYPGTTTFKMNVTPIPSANGTFLVHYYGVPADWSTAGSDDAQNILVPMGYEDALVHFMTYSALQSDADPRWQEYKAAYEQTLANLEEAVTRGFDHPGQIAGLSTGMIGPGFYASEEWW